jgi:hypothetical protein
MDVNVTFCCILGRLRSAGSDQAKALIFINEGQKKDAVLGLRRAFSRVKLALLGESGDGPSSRLGIGFSLGGIRESQGHEQNTSYVMH